MVKWDKFALSNHQKVASLPRFYLSLTYFDLVLTLISNPKSCKVTLVQTYPAMIVVFIDYCKSKVIVKQNKNSMKKSDHGSIKVGAEKYGGGIWMTWFDRDLKLAGRALVRGKDGKVSHKLVHINKVIFFIFRALGEF